MGSLLRCRWQHYGGVCVVSWGGPLLLVSKYLASGPPPQSPVSMDFKAFLKIFKFFDIFTACGSLFHLFATLIGKALLLTSNLALGTTRFQGSMALLVVAPSLPFVISSISCPSCCFSPWIILYASSRSCFSLLASRVLRPISAHFSLYDLPFSPRSSQWPFSVLFLVFRCRPVAKVTRPVTQIPNGAGHIEYTVF